MSGADVLIDYDELSAVDTSLKNIITELQKVSDREDALQNAIGNPFGNGALRSKAHDFESGWSVRRGKLLEDIEKVEKHVDKVLEGFKNWDVKTGASISQATSGSKAPASGGHPAPQ